MPKIEEIKIEKFASLGFGLGHLDDGRVVLIKKVLPGDVIEAEVIKTKKNLAFGSVKKIIKPSKDRIKPRCPYFDQCGGCDYQNISYAKQLELKQALVEESLVHNKVEIKAEKIIPGSEKQYFYRNSIRFEFRHTSDGLKIARHNYLDPDRPVVTDFCFLQSDFSNKFFGEVAELYNSLGYRGDDLWQVKIREGQKTGEFMFEIITTTNSLPYKKELIELIKKHPEIKSAFHTVTIEKNIYNLSRRLIFGRPIIYEKIGKFKFQISPESFFQTNSEGAEALYDKIKKFADIKFGDEIIDLFCGTGSIGIYLSTLAKKVTGIEVVPEAVRDAKDNAKINKINNCDFICSDVFKLKISDFKFDNKIIIIDPPRAGLSKDLILWLSTFNFKTLVYVSCNPATFARDLKYFSEKGIIAKKIQPIDMFPQTHHVEIISELVKSS